MLFCSADGAVGAVGFLQTALVTVADEADAWKLVRVRGLRLCLFVSVR
jgi:hypothetical protein